MIREKFLKLAVNPSSDLNQLRTLQEEIAQRIVKKDDFDTPIASVGGVDSAYIDETVITACVVLKWPTLELLEKKIVVGNATFPYISTFFVFREGPSILQVLSRLEIMPTILMLDSHGIAHPAFAGCASHIGVMADLPTIGVAKNILCGSWKADPISVGEWSPINFSNRVIGAYYLSQNQNKPIIISIGHRISLETAIKVTKTCIKGHRLPEPTFFAHQVANDEKKKIEMD
jgi:deoxyribonuclease V